VNCFADLVRDLDKGVPGDDNADDNRSRGYGWGEGDSRICS
jgi:hypothetical protein